jgi:hypothetical protein
MNDVIETARHGDCARCALYFTDENAVGTRN